MSVTLPPSTKVYIPFVDNDGEAQMVEVPTPDKWYVKFEDAEGAVETLATRVGELRGDLDTTKQREQLHMQRESALRLLLCNVRHHSYGNPTPCTCARCTLATQVANILNRE